MEASVISAGVIAEAKVLPAHMLHAARQHSAAEMHASANASNVSGPDHPADVSTAFEATDMASSHHPAGMRAAEAADVAAAAKAATARLGRRGHQCRSKRGRCQDHHHSFHHKNPLYVEALGRRYGTRQARCKAAELRDETENGSDERPCH
jgi:hypothetical protein